MLQQAGERGAHSNVIVVVEIDDIAEVVVLVPARAAAMAGPLVCPEAVVSCTQMQLIQQQIVMIATAKALSATLDLMAPAALQIHDGSLMHVAAADAIDKHGQKCRMQPWCPMQAKSLKGLCC